MGSPGAGVYPARQAVCHLLHEICSFLFLILCKYHCLIRMLSPSHQNKSSCVSIYLEELHYLDHQVLSNQKISTLNVNLSQRQMHQVEIATGNQELLGIQVNKIFTLCA
jgi:hypothetical protein